MDSILSNIGPNKVKVPIMTNEYEETNPYMEEHSRFDQIEDIIDIFKDSKPRRFDQIDVKYSPPRQSIDVTRFNSLIYSVLESIDVTMSLLSDDEKMSKVNQFKKQLNSKIDLGVKRVFGYDRVSYQQFLKNEDLKILNWLSHFLKKTIVLKLINPDITFNFYGTEDNCIVIEEDNHGTFVLLNNNDTVENWKVKKFQILASKYSVEKLNSMLIKDLKNIAQELEIPLFKVENDKKKSYLKNDLRDMIISKLFVTLL